VPTGFFLKSLAAVLNPQQSLAAGGTLADAEAFRICAQCVKLGDCEVRESIAKGRDSQESAPLFFCTSCATILPLEDLTSTDYFSIFGM
jgi:hypothetical protein